MEILIPSVIHGLESCFALRFEIVFIGAFQSSLGRSTLKLSLDNLEKSYTFDFLILILSLIDFRTQNWEKWSLISQIIFPQAATWSGLLIKMLSIRVAKVERTRVGLSIERKRKQLWREDKKSWLYEDDAHFRRSMLKSPMITMCFPEDASFSIVSSKNDWKISAQWVMLSTKDSTNNILLFTKENSAQNTWKTSLEVFSKIR